MDLPQRLANNLVLRQATIDDTEALGVFNLRVHEEAHIDAYTRDLMTGEHPTTSAADWSVVEDIATGKIVSAMVLISQQWSYGGIPLAVGRPELVGTDIDYRGQGLIRQQMAVLHDWSAARGELLQAITGIPWFYRQFGYEMAVDLSTGRRGFVSQIPPLATDTAEPYQLRPATLDDLPFIQTLYTARIARSLLACLRDEATWRYELTGRDPLFPLDGQFAIITTSAGESVGYLRHDQHSRSDTLYFREYELCSGVSYLAVTPSILRYLGRIMTSLPTTNQCTNYVGALGTNHPVFAALPALFPQELPPYAWYLRVPDLPRLLHAIAPLLATQLAASPLAGYSGDQLLSFYRSGLRLRFDQGQLMLAEPWQPTPSIRGDFAFPGLTFLQLLFGYRTLAELRHAFADCRGNDEAAVLLSHLFPKQPSTIWPLG